MAFVQAGRQIKIEEREIDRYIYIERERERESMRER